tara:strand:+ start:155 stop:715 length:561 start_codon:yes stop_codon:yes gene_type:complete
MKKLFIVILLGFTNLYLFGQNKNINLQLSKIKWTGKEITTKTHYGSLKFASGNILFENDEIVGGEFIVDMLSLINEDLTGGSRDYLENHLRSEDFFSVEEYPKSSLKITSIEKIDREKYEVTGDLTIKGITKSTNFILSLNNEGATVEMVFDRSKFDVKYRSSSFFSNLGDKLIYDDIELEVSLYF